MSTGKNAEGDLAACHAVHAKTVAVIAGLRADEFAGPTVVEDYRPLA